MKLLLIFAVAAVSSCWASDHPDTCGRLQRLKVKTQWVEAVGYAETRENFNEDIWNSIFEDHDGWRSEYFSEVRGENIMSPEFRAHAARITSGFDLAINFLMYEEVLNQHLGHLGAFHKEMAIPAENFDVFGHAVMVAVHERVGRCFDWDAWNLCMGEITSGIQTSMA